jgi:hypothetical protein
LTKASFDLRFDFLSFDVAENGEHAIVRPGMLVVKGFEIGDLNVADAGLSAEGIQTVSNIAEERPAHATGGALEELIFLRADAGQLDLPFALQFGSRETWIEHHVSQQIKPESKIAAQDFDIESKAVVPAVAINAAANRFDFFGDALGGTAGGPLEQHPRSQLSNPVIGNPFGQHATLEHGAKFHKGKPMIFFDEQAKAICQRELLNGVLLRQFDIRNCFGRSAARQQCIKRLIFGREILARDALEVCGRDALNGGEVSLRKIEIVSGEPRAPQILRLPGHGLAHR